MRCSFLALLALVAAPAFAQSPSLLADAEAEYADGHYAASDSLYALALGAPDAVPTASSLYNAASSAALAGRTDRAFSLLDASAAAGWENTAHARTDADLASLRTNPTRWAAFEAAIEASMAARYGERFDLGLRNELVAIRETDQAGRLEMMRLQREAEPARRDSLMADLWTRQTPIDEANLARVEQIVAESGWPGYALVGRDGAQTVFLVVQHAGLEAQQRYLPLMQAAVDASDANPSELALLVDRVRVRTDRPQLYGSQLRRNDATGAMEFYPIEDEPEVDARRAAMGLEPLADYARYYGIEYVLPAE